MNEKYEVRCNDCMTTRKCLNCGYEQAVHYSNIYQDIKGKYVICEDCGSSFDVEIEVAEVLKSIGYEITKENIEYAEKSIKERSEKEKQICKNCGLPTNEIEFCSGNCRGEYAERTGEFI